MKITVAEIEYVGSCFPKNIKSMYKYSVENNCRCKLIKSTMDVKLKTKNCVSTKIVKKEKEHSYFRINI